MPIPFSVFPSSYRSDAASAPTAAPSAVTAESVSEPSTSVVEEHPPRFHQPLPANEASFVDREDYTAHPAPQPERYVFLLFSFFSIGEVVVCVTCRSAGQSLLYSYLFVLIEVDLHLRLENKQVPLTPSFLNTATNPPPNRPLRTNLISLNVIIVSELTLRLLPLLLPLQPTL